MSNSGKTRAAILAAIDYSESSTFVVEHAALLAQQSRPCDLHFLHVNPLRAPDAAADDDECCRLELLEWLAARLPADGEALAGVSVITHEASGDPAHTIVELAADLLVDHVVVGTHGRRGLERLVLGSVAEDVSRRCGCSVLVVRQQQHEHPLEPVCGVCVEARIQSQGNVPWCHDHVPRNDRRHALERRAGRWVRALAGETRSPRRVSPNAEEMPNAECPIGTGSTCPSPAQRGRGEPGTNLGHEAQVAG